MIHRFHRFLVDGTWKRNKIFAFSNENAVWNLSLNHSAVRRPTRKKGTSRSLVVIESDSIAEDDRVCWRFRRSFLRCRGSRLTLLSMMTDISSHFKVPRRHKAVQVVRKYSKASLVFSGSHWVSEHACVFLGLSCLLSSAPTELISSDAIDWPWKSCGLDSPDVFD